MEHLFEYDSDSEASVEIHRKSKIRKLDIPSDVRNLFATSPYDPVNVSIAYEHKKDPNESGFIRLRPHERGVWPSHIYIDVPTNPEMVDMIEIATDNFKPILDEVSKKSGPIKLHINEDLHLSLCRPFYLRTHQIEPFKKLLESKLLNVSIFRFEVAASFDILTNDTGSRSFLCLKVVSDWDPILKLIGIVDEILDAFQQPKYYEDPKLHVSVASVPSDISNFQITNQDDSEVDVVDVEARSITLKTGKSCFKLELKLYH